MSLSMHTASVPVFQQLHTALSGVLTRAESHAAVFAHDVAELLRDVIDLHAGNKHWGVWLLSCRYPMTIGTLLLVGLHHDTGITD